MITALAPQLAGIAIKSDEARAEVEAFLGVLTRGLKPAAAERTGGAALSMLRAKKNVIYGLTGIDVVDKNNEIIPSRIVPAFQKIQERVHRSTRDPAVRRRILENFFGEDVAAALERVDLRDVKRVARESKDRGTTAEEARAYVESIEGEREKLKIRAEQRKRRAGEEAVPLSDRWERAVDRFATAAQEGFAEIGKNFTTGSRDQQDVFGGKETEELLRKIEKNTAISRFDTADLARSMERIQLRVTMQQDPNAPRGN